MRPFTKKVYCPWNNAHERGRAKQGCPKGSLERLGQRSGNRFVERLQLLKLLADN